MTAVKWVALGLVVWALLVIVFLVGWWQHQQIVRDVERRDGRHRLFAGSKMRDQADEWGPYDDDAYVEFWSEAHR